MTSLFKKYMPFFLLFSLAWSCFGLNVGMIGHEMLMAQEHPQSFADHESKHDCCVISDSGEENQNALGIDHHSAAADATIVSASVYLFIALLLAIVLEVLFIWRQRYISGRLYRKRWQEQWAYFALLWNQLFSRGILHPKTW